jgi:thymidylate synthase
MKQYLEALQHIMDNGEVVEDRTGTGTKTVFGYQMRFNLQDGFPAVTTKKLAWRSVVSELLWFLEGSSDERRLAEILYGKVPLRLIDKKTIWTDNADNQGKALGYVNTETRKELGPVYGVQWRNIKSRYKSGPKDQLCTIIDQIKNDPDSRRIILNSWNVDEIDNMALPPCHVLAQFRVINGKLSCQLYQRSADMFLGVPFNIASYALLTHILANECNLEVGEFIWVGGDCHIYLNHMDQVKEQLTRGPQELPELWWTPKPVIFEYNVDDFSLKNYRPLGSIKAPMAI